MSTYTNVFDSLQKETASSSSSTSGNSAAVTESESTDPDSPISSPASGEPAETLPTNQIDITPQKKRTRAPGAGKCELAIILS